LKRFITLPPFSEIKGFPDDLPQNNLYAAIASARIAGSSKPPFKKWIPDQKKMNLPHQLNN
jgi:hypothetical protein